MEFFDVKLESDSISVGGWVMEQLNHVPVQGESFSACHMEITVSEVSACRVSLYHGQAMRAGRNVYGITKRGKYGEKSTGYGQ